MRCTAPGAANKVHTAPWPE